MGSTGEVKGKISTGIPHLDQIFKGGLPQGAVILYLGDAGSRKDLFGYNFYIDGLIKGEETVLFNTESNMEILRSRLNQTLAQKAPGKKLADFKNGTIVDVIPTHSNLYIRAAAVKILDYLDKNPSVVRVLINSLTHFVRHYPMDEIVDFIRELETRACLEPLNTVVMDMAIILEERDLNNVMDKCDGVLEFISQRVNKELMRSLFVEKLEAEISQESINYDVVSEGIVIERIDRIR